MNDAVQIPAVTPAASGVDAHVSTDMLTNDVCDVDMSESVEQDAEKSGKRERTWEYYSSDTELEDAASSVELKKRGRPSKSAKTAKTAVKTKTKSSPKPRSRKSRKLIVADDTVAAGSDNSSPQTQKSFSNAETQTDSHTGITTSIQTEPQPAAAGDHSKEMSKAECSFMPSIEKCITALIAPVSADVGTLQSQLQHLTLFIQQLSAQVTILKAQITADVKVQSGVDSQHAVADAGDLSPAAAAAVIPAPNRHDELRQDVMTSVYIDLSLKERRAKNVVISGLACSNSDTAAVRNLLRSEFEYIEPIISCKRIGKPSAGKIQSIAVTLANKDQARYLIDNARRLRRSSDATVRQNVYLNADLTPSESRAAYELRCRRREQRQQSAGASRVFYRSAVGGVEESPSGVRSTLNPNSSAFLPSASAVRQSSVQQGQADGSQSVVSGRPC